MWKETKIQKEVTEKHKFCDPKHYASMGALINIKKR